MINQLNSRILVRHTCTCFRQNNRKRNPMGDKGQSKSTYTHHSRMGVAPAREINLWQSPPRSRRSNPRKEHWHHPRVEDY